MKSSRNRTIDTTCEAGGKHLDKCLFPTGEKLSVDAVRDRIICGDILQTAPLLPEKSVDLLIADPPYNLTKSFDGTVFKSRPAQDYCDYTRKWLNAVYPLLKENASVYVCCDWRTSLLIGGVLEEFFILRNRITWQREKGRGAKNNWKNSCEDIFFATVGSEYEFYLDAVKVRRKVIATYRQEGKPKDWQATSTGNYRDSCPGNFWDDITIPFWSMPENTAHPTQKPEKLIAKLILASSSPGSVVFDPFAGSGTTAVTAKKLDRHFIAAEIEPRYCIWAQQRLAMAELDRSIQGFHDGIFYERNTTPEARKESSL